jgi:hypothetical protein
MELHILLIAIAAGWTGDDWCPTPPRPPWPWPWWSRKLLAIIGAVGFVWYVPLAGGGDVDIISAVGLGLVGGAALASLVGHLAGGFNRTG